MFNIINEPIKKLSERKRILQSVRDISHQNIQIGYVVLDLAEAASEFSLARLIGGESHEVDRFLKVQKRLFDALNLLAQASGKLAEQTLEMVYGDGDVDNP